MFLDGKKKQASLLAWHKITKEHVSKWIKTAALAQLEHAVYMGRGGYMLGRTAWNDDVRAFLQTVPKIASSIEEFHSAAAKGDEDAVQKHLASDRKLISSRDQVRNVF